MNWLEAQTALLDSATGAVQFAVHWLVQSTLLLAAGLAIGWWMRRRGSAVQSVVYRTTLATVLICPLATWSLSLVGVSGWSVTLPEGWTYREDPSPHPDVRTTAPLTVDKAPEPASPPIAPSEPFAADGSAAMPAESRLQAPATTEAGTFSADEPPSVAVQSPVAPSAETASKEAPQLLIHRFGWIALVGAAIWLFGSALLVARLGIAWRRLGQLRRYSLPAGPEIMDECHDVASLLRVSAPEVFLSPFLPSPCLVGLRRPAVLLPEGQPGLSVRDALIHELAHLKRHDCHWNLLRHVTVALFFFQPLLVVLSRRMERTAEEVCDDYVIRHGGDRRQYAHRLVDLAELSTAPIAAAGVGIVSLRSMLAQRVTRIMDTSRTLSTRVGNLLLLMVVLGGVIGTATVGLVGLGSHAHEAGVESINSEPKLSQNAQIEDEGSLTGVNDDDDIISVRGHVVDPSGRPLPDADIYVLQWSWNSGDWEALAHVKTDETGTFEISYRKTQFFETAGRHAQWRDALVVAFADGFGPDWVGYDKIAPGEETTLRLAIDDVPIEGRIVDLEGNPIAGASLELRTISRPHGDNLDAWITRVKANQPPSLAQRALRESLPAFSAKRWSKIVTDADGRFRLTGIGRERLVTFMVKGPTTVTTRLRAVTRPMEPIVQPAYAFPGSHDVTNYGARFQYAAAPSRRIEGVARDAETGETLANVQIWSHRISGTNISGLHEAKTTTDENGRYRLDGMPKGEGNQIIVVPRGLPYFTAKFDVPDPAGFKPVRLDLPLNRGTWVKGRVIDNATGRGVAARMYYLACPDNEHAAELKEFRETTHVMIVQDRYHTDREGYYRVVALPGRGVIGAGCILTPYPGGQGLEDIADATDIDGYSKYNGVLVPVKKYPTAVKEINVAPDTREVVCDFQLDPGRRVTLHVVDEDGEDVEGVTVDGQSAYGGRHDVFEAQFDLLAFREDETRTVLLQHTGRRLGKVLRIQVGDKSSQPITVELEPMATVKGRLVADGAPIRGAMVHFYVWKDGNYGKQLENATTDSVGRFTHPEVLPGLPYSVSAEGKDIEFASVTEKLSVQSGEMIDLGTIDVTSDERPEPVRTKTAVSAGTDTSGNHSAEKHRGSADQQTDNEASQEYQGRVVDSAGRPVAGAKLYLVTYDPQPTGLLVPSSEPISTTDAAGSFRFATEQESRHASLVAVKEGFGFAWSQAGQFQTGGAWLREARQRWKDAPTGLREHLSRLLDGVGQPLQLVVDDPVIQGRIVDIDGRPVAGARLTLLRVWTGSGDDLTAWRDAAHEPKADFYSARMKTPLAMNGPQVRALVTPAVTDSEGQFTLRGVGRSRIAQLLVEGPGIESAKIFARTEAGEKIVLLRERRSPELGSYTYYPSELTYVAGPSVAITGVVRDATSREPLSGVTVKSQSRHGEQISGWGQDFVRAVTDEQGNYRLEGMPIGSDNRIAAIAPDRETPYLSMSKRVTTDAADSPPEVDFDLPRGVWIEGRITDKQTGKGLSGRLAYYVSKNSPNYEVARSLYVDERDRLLADDEGHFRIAALPGAGFVAFMAHEHQNYPRTQAIIALDGTRKKIDSSMLKTGSLVLFPQNYHLVAEVDPPADAVKVELNLQLDSGNTVRGHVVGPDGESVTGYLYTGQMAQFDTWHQSTGAGFELRGYDPESGRHVYIADLSQDLAGHVHLQGSPTDELVVRLKPAGKVKGRLVDADGAPLADCQLFPWYPPMSSPADSLSQQRAPPLPPTSQQGRDKYETDPEGRFEISCLTPNLEYRLQARSRELRSIRRRIPVVSGQLDVVIRVDPGESIDLGDVRLKDAAKTSSVPNNTDRKPRTMPAPHKTVVSGRIAMAGNKPAAGCHVAVIAMRIQPSRGGDLAPPGAVLAEGTTGDDGTYGFTIEGASSKTHRYAQLIARTENTAVAWKQINLDSTSVDGSLDLSPEEPITGRFVDIEGQPAGGVQLQVRSVIKRSNDGVPVRDGVGYRGGDSVPAAWLPPVVSGDAGSFTVRGVPSGYGVFLNVVGSDRFAPQSIALNTGMPEQRGERDGTYRSLVKNVDAGQQAVLPLAPAQLFEGTVTYEDTSQPAAHARLTIWASQQEFGSMLSVPGKADEHGKYRISPNPGIRFGITAYPPDGVPYLTRQLKPVRWADGATSKQVDVTLPRGVLVRGRVLETGSDTPVAGVAVQYIPEQRNNPNTADDILTGWQGIQLSDDQGEFEIVVLPGPGRLLANASHGTYVLQEISGEQLSAGKRGGRRHYAHAVEEIHPKNESEPIDVTLRLEPGATVAGKIVDENGERIDECLVITHLKTSPYSLTWRGHVTPTLGGRYELSGLKQDREYTVYFLDPRRRLGATISFVAENPPHTVTLHPCGEATMRFVDAAGVALSGYEASIQFVARPGAHPFDNKTHRSGTLAADIDFISNIDRVNYPNVSGTDADSEGRLTLPALIPGATYWIITRQPDNDFALSKEFIAESGRTIDLGDIEVHRPD